MGFRDSIGSRGEAIAFKELARFCRVDLDLPYFVPHYLGEKCPRFDFLVELVHDDEIPLYFFVQVKATRRDYARAQMPYRLRVEISTEDVRQMVACPVPTYLIGVHDREERAFIIAIHGEMSESISSMTTAHELNADTLEKLWREVREFWRERDFTQTTSLFLN